MQAKENTYNDHLQITGEAAHTSRLLIRTGRNPGAQLGHTQGSRGCGGRPESLSSHQTVKALTFFSLSLEGLDGGRKTAPSIPLRHASIATTTLGGANRRRSTDGNSMHRGGRIAN